MKYAPKKVFILENGKYKEITYSELQELEQSGKSYTEKFFLPLYGMLMEVTAETYKWYYNPCKNKSSCFAFRYSPKTCRLPFSQVLLRYRFDQRDQILFCVWRNYLFRI